MKRLFLLFLLFFALFTIFAQSPAKYWIQFKDKQGTPYSIDKPLEFLSPKAIERREKYNIKITEQDLPVSPTYIQKVLALDSNIILFTKSKWLNGITIYSENENIIDKIRALDFVTYCERTIPMKEPEEQPNSYFYFQNGNIPTVETGIPNDIDYGLSYGQIKINNVHWLHRMGFKGEGIHMMILDGGFHNLDTIRHFSLLRSQNRLREARHVVQPGVNPFLTGSHGTMVLSCIASYIPGEIVGSAPGVIVWLAQTEDGRSENKVEEDNWVAGVEWADSLGIYIINSSLGYTKFDDSTQVRNYSHMNGKTSRASIAASYLASKGIVLCNSVGNEGDDKWKFMGAPAEATDILAVGGVNSKGERAPFSSYGPSADGRIKPDAVAVGWDTYVGNTRGKTIKGNGTSFSSPLMSGMVACLWQAFPNKNAYEIMHAIRMSGDKATAPDNSLGYGITDMLKAYNYLLQKSDPNFEVQISNYVIQKNKIEISIIVKNPTEITIKTSLRNSLKKQIVKKYTLKEGDQTIIIKTPKISKKAKYDLVDLFIENGGAAQPLKYVLGYENPKKK